MLAQGNLGPPGSGESLGQMVPVAVLLTGARLDAAELPPWQFNGGEEVERLIGLQDASGYWTPGCGGLLRAAYIGCDARWPGSRVDVEAADRHVSF